MSDKICPRYKSALIGYAGCRINQCDAIICDGPSCGMFERCRGKEKRMTREKASLLIREMRCTEETDDEIARVLGFKDEEEGK